MRKVRDKLRVRGARGLIGLAKEFKVNFIIKYLKKVVDEEGKGSADLKEFSKVLNSCRIGLSEGEAKNIFAEFDINQSGAIDYEEFIGIIKVLFYFEENYCDLGKTQRREKVLDRKCIYEFGYRAKGHLQL